MKNRNKVLMSLLVSSQILGIATPVMAERNPDEGDVAYTVEDTMGDKLFTNHLTKNYEGEPVKTEDSEKAEKLILSETYSDELKKELDALYDRAKKIETYGDLDTIVNDYTNIIQHVNKQDAAHNLADSRLIGQGLSFQIHELIRNEIYLLGGAGSTRLINYGNKLVMAMSQGAFGFENQIHDLSDTHQIFAADDEIYRLRTYASLFMNTLANDGEMIEFEMVAGRLVYPLHRELDVDIKKPQADADYDIDKGERELNDGVISGDDNLYPGGELGSATSNLGSRTGEYYEYDEVNGRRILVRYTIEIVNGKEQRSETRTVDATGLTSMWSDRFGGGGSGGTIIERHGTNQGAEEKSRLTLQYTLNKDSKFPSFVDTGLFTDLDGNASYKSLYETLFQIAANVENGFLVEDSDKLLIVVEGKPIYIAETKEVYSKDEVESIFKEFKTVGLVISETRIGTTNSLEWQLRTGQKQNIVIDGDKVKMKNEPSIRGERVVLPIVEIMKAVGADVVEGGDLITVRYKDDVVTFESGVSQARVNGNLIDLTVPVEVDERGTQTANLTPIFKALGIESVWDEEASTLFLDNTLRTTVVTQKDVIGEESDKEDDEEVSKEQNEDKDE